MKDLLDDLYSFSVGDQDSYFLQPLVVKAIGSPEENKWEVLDGQQRLTTMLLFLKKVISVLLVPAYKDKYDKVKELSLEFASSFAGVPYHSGAVQYFADKDITVEGK